MPLAAGKINCSSLFHCYWVRVQRYFREHALKVNRLHIQVPVIIKWAHTSRSFSHRRSQVLNWFITFPWQYSPRPLVLIIIQTWLKYNQLLAIRGLLLGNCASPHVDFYTRHLRWEEHQHSCLCLRQIISWWTTAPASERAPATRWKWRRTASKCASPAPTSVRKVSPLLN